MSLDLEYYLNNQLKNAGINKLCLEVKSASIPLEFKRGLGRDESTVVYLGNLDNLLARVLSV